MPRHAILQHLKRAAPQDHQLLVHVAVRRVQSQDHGLDKSLDNTMLIGLAKPALEGAEKVRAEMRTAPRQDSHVPRQSPVTNKAVAAKLEADRTSAQLTAAAEMEPRSWSGRVSRAIRS